MTFDELLRNALEGPPRAAEWDELTNRLLKLSSDELGLFPEAVLTPEVRELIEAIVDAQSCPEDQQGPR